MTRAPDERPDVSRERSIVRPRDAAGLVLLRGSGEEREILLGRRRRTARFLPGVYVFPGGGLELEDRRPSGFAERWHPLPEGLDRATHRKAAALLRAAVRETLEETGVIRGYRATLDPARLGLDVQAFIQVQLARHGAEEGAAFARLLRTRAEITSAWTMTGEADYLLRVYCSDLPALNTLIHEVLLAHPVVSRVHSQIVMDQLKADAPLPIG